METSRQLAFWDGRIVPVDEIRISPMDIGLLRGYGVFDVMRTENGKPFLHERHWARLERSAETLGLRLPVTLERHREIVSGLMEKNGLGQASIRTVLTGGTSQGGFLPDPDQETFFVLVTPFEPLADEYYSVGAKLITLDHTRLFPHAKITNYIAAIRHAPTRLAEEALEILYVRDGRVYEASTSNFAAVIDGTIVAPVEGVLGGITRGLTLELAREARMPVEERNLSWDELLRAEEAFITATNKYIVPVVRVDEHVIGAGMPGETTKRLMEAMENFVEKY